MAFRYKPGIAILIALSAFSQSSPPVAFEVASIRPSAPIGQTRFSVGLHIDGSQVRCMSWTLRDYVALAYRTKTIRVSGPDWSTTDHFDVSAAIPADGKRDQVPEMFRSLLSDRFQLKMHEEKREFSVYVLLPGKPSPRLKESVASPDIGNVEPQGAVNVEATGSSNGIGVSLGHGASFTFANGRFDAKRLTMDNLAYTLEWYADRQIIDMTGMTSQYDFTLDFTPEDYRAMMIQAGVTSGVQMPVEALRLLDGHSSAAFGDALQQIGLRLEARKVPLDVIVIDSALKTPTEN